MRSTGIHVAVEGLDGAGKSTLIARLGQELAAEFETSEFRLPEREAIAGVNLTDIITNKEPAPSPGVLALAFAANRLDSYEKHIAPYLAGGVRIALSHRYVLSGLAYQSAQGVDLQWLYSINAVVPAPALTIFVDTDPAVCEKRISQRGGNVELFEEEFVHMRKHFMYSIDLLRDAGWEIAVLDGGQDVAALGSAAAELVRARLAGGEPV